MDYETKAQLLDAFYRMVGMTSDDDALIENGEGVDDVAYGCLTRGFRAAQRYLLDNGYDDWNKRSAAITWSGSEATGGLYFAVPADCLRIYGKARGVGTRGARGISALVEADGTRWGQQVSPADDYLTGDGFYVRQRRVWLLKQANPPSTLYLDYHQQQEEIDADIVDANLLLPFEARPLGVAYAAQAASGDDWWPGDEQVEARVARAVSREERQARSIARLTKQPRTMGRPVRYGNRW